MFGIRGNSGAKLSGVSTGQRLGRRQRHYGQSKEVQNGCRRRIPVWLLTTGEGSSAYEAPE